uniref:OmpA-OmpF porin, OOP family n=1 Tax=Candidatus Kentrum sp. FW TaxID=2126338 RepID=A0A450TQK7_9GAMM|nr:MAG: OmpA-OmpF porin, OOP family [Candidatus Kentron sp. FW]VFJ70405.1 MAG: OmpA-OmpF porin, OOP family [Candidatus Kentron sp. FW]
MKTLHLLVLSIALVISGCATTDQKVPDNPDRCADTPADVPVDKNGCPDSDGDGVPDNRDKCSDTKGVRLCEKGFSRYSGPEDMLKCWDRRSEMEGIYVDGEGCPIDSDEDGVSDYWDQCPNTRPGIKTDDKGCIAGPEAEVQLEVNTEPVIEINKIDVQEKERKTACGELLADLPRKVHFDFDEYYIRHEDSYILDDVIKALKNTATPIRLEGHADDIGTEEYNLHLSRKRAWEVKNYLVSRGIPEDGITTEGKGKLFPVTHDRTRQGRARNRRVEILCQPRSEP